MAGLNQCFFRLHQISRSTQVKNVKKKIYFIWNCFGIFVANSLKRRKWLFFTPSNTFGSTREREESKVNRFMLCFISYFHLKLLTSKRYASLVPVCLYFLSEALMEQLRKDKLLFNFVKIGMNSNIDKRPQQFIFSILHLQ